MNMKRCEKCNSVSTGNFCVKCGGKLLEIESKETVGEKTNKRDGGITWINIIMLIGAFLLLIGVLVFAGLKKFDEYEDKIAALNRSITKQDTTIKTYKSEIAMHKDTIYEYKAIKTSYDLLVK